MFVAYADRAGVIGFCHHAMAPTGTYIFTKGDDLDALTARVAPLARHAYEGETLLIPGVPEAKTDTEAYKALNAWRRRAFPKDGLHLVEGVVE